MFVFICLVFSQKLLNLEEALAYLEEPEAEEGANIDEIFIEPRDPNIESDEDSAEEDGGGLIDNLTGQQLRSGVEVKLTNTELE